jgi:acyl-CoA reductase-like NAD-dependent aldehyde dehydrogenase
MIEYPMFIDGQAVFGGTKLTVVDKYTGEPLALVSVAEKANVEQAIAAARRGAATMAAMPAHRRAEILGRAAALLRERREDFARTIVAEAGKALKFARAEADRGAQTFVIASEEAKRIHGETVSLDAVPAGEGYFGLYLRRPVGVVAAISPFNFPLNLVAHKVAPALAAGNAVVLKPASTTPVTAMKLAEVLTAAGLPAGALNVVVGSGGTVGEWLVTDPRVDKITFTGSPAVGRRITAVAGIKKITLELGNTSPVVIAEDADLDVAAKRCAVGAYYNSGQVCLSVQRIYCQRPVYPGFRDRFVSACNAMVVGNPHEEDVDVGPMIDEREAVRIEGWVEEARSAGAKVLAGGRRKGATYWPTVLADVDETMKVVSEEAFAPVASVFASEDFESALAAADATSYGLQAAVFTRDIDRVLRAVRRLDFGGIVVNDAPIFRADHMPYGGNRQSGIGREGVRHAIEEMTNIQMVSIRTNG